MRIACLHLLALFAVVATVQARAADAPIPLPADYRQWAHVKSMLIYGKGHPLYKEFPGIHHIYANPSAAAALRKDANRFPDGSVFVCDLLAAAEQGGAWVEGARKLVFVMVKDAARYPETGGWGFALFEHGEESSRVEKDPKTDCFGCHEAQRDHDYVFSRWRP
jgi:hypothetical protein